MRRTRRAPSSGGGGVCRRVRALRVLAVALATVGALLLSSLAGAGSMAVGSVGSVGSVGTVGTVAVAADEGDGGDGGGEQKDDGKDQGQDGDQNDDQKKDDEQKKKEQEDQEKKDGDQKDDEDFPGRDQIGKAGDDEYTDIRSVSPGDQPGEGGRFSGGSYSIECDLSDHKNSDNPLLAPGKRNGAQHTHDYAGNDSTNAASDEATLEEAGTTCTNGDRTPIFWPVLRDLGGVGPDEGLDGGSLDGNVGSLVEPTSVDYTFHGHGTRETQPMPLNMVLVTGSAKAGTENGDGANAKYTCAGAGGRLTDQYPVCPEGSALQRVFDFPSCWNGRDLDSEDHISHIAFPDEDGECADDETPVPALRISVNYENVPPNRSFAIDSFPEQQHDPITDHALIEYLSSERRAQEGVECINGARRCVQGPETDAAASLDPADQEPPSLNFAHAMATHARGHAHGGHGAPGSRPHETPAPRRPSPPGATP